MSINEIKDLTKFLSPEEIDKIKLEMKSKEDILKSGNLEEEEMTLVLNTLFAILVIEKALESEIEGVEEIRGELEQELLEAYNVYDTFMFKYQKEEKKKKKNWFLDLLGINRLIRDKKNTIDKSNQTIDRLKEELSNLKQKRSNENLAQVANKTDVGKFKEFCDYPKEYKDHRKQYQDNQLNAKMAVKRAQVQSAKSTRYYQPEPVSINPRISTSSISVKPKVKKTQTVVVKTQVEEKIKITETEKVGEATLKNVGLRRM